MYYHLTPPVSLGLLIFDFALWASWTFVTPYTGMLVAQQIFGNDENKNAPPILAACGPKLKVPEIPGECKKHFVVCNATFSLYHVSFRRYLR